MDNVASAFCAVAQLPEFRETPAARAAMENLLLASRCRVALAEDDRTYYASFQVQADRGNVSVSYLPRHLKVAESIAAVVEKVPGVRQIVATMAASRILWIQEHFNPTGETFQHVVEVAKKWGAAVELLRLKPAETSFIVEQATAGQDVTAPAATRGTGGIEDDVPADTQSSRLREGGVEETFNELVKLGKAGGRMVVARHGKQPADRDRPLDLLQPGGDWRSLSRQGKGGAHPAESRTGEHLAGEVAGIGGPSRGNGRALSVRGQATGHDAAVRGGDRVDLRGGLYQPASGAGLPHAAGDGVAADGGRQRGAVYPYSGVLFRQGRALHAEADQDGVADAAALGGHRRHRGLKAAMDLFPYALTTSTMLQVVLLGLIGGTLSGFIGSGGAFFMTPGMMNLGVPGVIAVGSNITHKFGKALVGSRQAR